MGSQGLGGEEAPQDPPPEAQPSRAGAREAAARTGGRDTAQPSAKDQELQVDQKRRRFPRRAPALSIETSCQPTSKPSVQVRVNTIVGVEYVVNAGRHWTLGQVKKALQIHSSIPAKEQRLVKGTTVLLDDSQQVVAIMGGSPIPDAGEGVCDRSRSEGGRLELTLVRRTSQQAIWLQRVGRLGIMLYDVPHELKADRELVLTAIKQNEEAFQHADSSLQADRSFVLAAVQLNPAVLPYVSGAFRNDRDVVLAAVSRRGEVLACAGADLRKDREVVLQAVRQHGLSLRYASETLRGDRGLAIAAAEQNAGAVAYASEALRSDQEVLLAALRSKVYALDEAHEQRFVDEVEISDPFHEMLLNF